MCRYTAYERIDHSAGTCVIRAVPCLTEDSGAIDLHHTLVALPGKRGGSSVTSTMSVEVSAQRLFNVPLKHGSQYYKSLIM
jgi:hypothetical protein